LYRPGYRIAGPGVLITAQLCRLPGWAAPSPTRLRAERIDARGKLGDSHEVALSRLGMRAGNNCTAISVRLASRPDYMETLKVCAQNRRGSCP
jgi:hypothetical protein